MLRNLLAIVLLFAGNNLVHAQTGERLSMPREVRAALVATQQTQVVYFHITNQTSQARSIQGYNASCSCSSVAIQETKIPPGKTTTVRVKINRQQPYQTQVFLVDDKTTVYAVQIHLQ